ncbi:hypothetical protein JCM5350_005505 [Sporobolomyces pararoseus]
MSLKLGEDEDRKQEPLSVKLPISPKQLFASFFSSFRRRSSSDSQTRPASTLPPLGAQELPPSRLSRPLAPQPLPPQLERVSTSSVPPQSGNRLERTERNTSYSARTKSTAVDSERDRSSTMQSESEISDEEQVFSVRAVCFATGENVNLCFKVEKACGFGSFGEVSRVRLLSGDGEGAVLALKRTKQDRRFKNRELNLMQNPTLRHPNIIDCKYAWQERNNPQESNHVTLYLLLEYIPQTLYTHYRVWSKRKLVFPELLCKVYLFQLLRALAWCHAIGVCHRDIKPHNILVEYALFIQETGRTVLIDFGSAKVLKPGDENVTYTCSRYYRAPELIFSNSSYGHAIGEQVLPPVDFETKLIEKKAFRHVTLPQASAEAISLLYGLLRYNPEQRLTASESLAHAFFDEIKQTEELYLPNGNKVDLDMLFLFSPEELSIRPDLNKRIIPPHFRPRLFEKTGVDLDDFHPRNLKQLQIDID